MRLEFLSGSAGPRTAPIRAVLFDLDGTLYRQRPLRAFMAAELALRPLVDPRGAPALWRALRSFRHAQEALRREGERPGLAARQIEMAAAACGLETHTVAALVEEWMQVRPLKYLARCRMPGTIEAFDALRAAEMPVGVLSDYPAAGKLRALGLADRVAWSICSTDPDVDAFKPHPKGFLRACDRFGLPPSQVLMVGDRADVDAAGAAAAGMPCIIIGRAAASPVDHVLIPSLERLPSVLHARC